MKLQKVLSLSLIAVLLLSLTSFAGFSDVSKDEKYAEAVTVLAQLEILNGYENGTFKPENTITRAEFAAIICKLMDMTYSAQGSISTFSDVHHSHWATGYISIMQSMEIVDGVGDEKFEPDGDILYEQAIKILVGALGYSPKAEVLGGYPTGYVMVANQLGVTANTANNTEGALRSTIALLIYNSLSVPKMDQISWGGPNGAEYATDYSQSLLYINQGIIKAEVKLIKVVNGEAEIEYISIDDIAKAQGWYFENDVEITDDENFRGIELPTTISAGGFDLSGLDDTEIDMYISINEENPVLSAYYIN